MLVARRLIMCAWFDWKILKVKFLNDFIVRPLGLHLRLSKALNKIVPVFHKNGGRKFREI